MTMTNYAPLMPHHGLQPIAENTWFVQGSVNLNRFVRLQRNMVALRHGGELTLINAIRLDDAGLAALEQLGRIAHVVKIGGHGMDDAFYLDRYGATHWALPEPAARLGAEVLSTEHLPHPGLSLFVFQDTKEPEGALVWEVDGGLLINCDSVQHWEPSDLMSLSAKVVTKVFGFQKPAQIGPLWLKVMTPEGGSLEPDFERLIAMPFRHIVGGHGGLCRDEGKPLLRATMGRMFG